MEPLHSTEAHAPSRRLSAAPPASVDALAEEFVARLRRGEHPSISEYAGRFPHWADEIADLFPTLALLEQAGRGVASAPFAKLSVPPLEQLGDYRILREVGRGGMGVVYEAEHLVMRRRVALKLLPADMARRATQLQRFQREVRAAGNLHHTNIVPIFEVGERDGYPYYTMQFIRGQSLDLVIAELRRLARGEPGRSDVSTAAASPTVDQRQVDSIAESLLSGGSIRFDEARSPSSSAPLAPEAQTSVVPRREVAFTKESSGGESDPSAPIDDHRLQAARRAGYFRRVARLGAQVADALAYAHQQGILHRDIKPSNLLLDTQGTIWVTDFGLAKYDEDGLTRSGDIVGTLRYLAPERLNGEADARSDIYSLGLTLYELCALRPAFDETDRVKLLKSVAEDPPPRPRHWNRHLPRDLETIILKAIDKHPAARYTTADQLAEDLRLFLADRPVLARRSLATERAWRWCRRNPAFAALAASVFALLSIVFCGALWFGVSSSRQAEASRRHATLLQASEAELSSALFDARLAQARASRHTGLSGRRVDGLAAVRDAVQLIPRLHDDDEAREEARYALRNEAIANLANADLRVAKAWSVREPWTAEIAIDPLYQSYAQPSETGEISIRSLDDHLELRRLPAQAHRAWRLAFSPDGKFLAARYHPPRVVTQQISVWNLETGAETLRELGPFESGDFAFSPDSRSIAIATRSPIVRIHRLDRHLPPAAIRLRSRPLAISFDPSGRWLVASDATGSYVERVSLRHDARFLWRLPGYVHAFAWNRDGSTLACGCEDGNIHYWDSARPFAKPRMLSGHTGAVVQLAINRQGDRLISTSWDGSTRLWDLPNRRQLVRADGVRIVGNQFSLDDRSIGFSTPRTLVGVWEVLDRGPLFLLGKSARHRAAVEYDAEHPHLAISATDAGAEFWDTSQGRLLATIPAGATRAARLTMDGESLITGGSAGVLRWPVYRNGDAWRVGEPETLMREPCGGFVLTPDGRRLIGLFGSSLAMINVTSEERRVLLIGTHQLTHQIDLSPDGRWLVSTAWQMGSGIRIWDVEQRQLARDLEPTSGAAYAAFSPHGRWLATAVEQRASLWDANDWTLMRDTKRVNDDRWAGPVAFSPDTRLLATLHSRHTIQLSDAISGRPLAILESSEPGMISRLRFNSTGTELAVVVDAGLQVWKLAELRRELAQLSLDWPVASPVASDAQPAEARVGSPSLVVAPARSSLTPRSAPAP